MENRQYTERINKLIYSQDKRSRILGFKLMNKHNKKLYKEWSTLSDLFYSEKVNSPTYLSDVPICDRIILSGDKIKRRDLSTKALHLLTNLESVLLFRVEEDQIPKNLHKCKNLKRLTITDSNLNTIPTEVLNLKNLQYLDLEYNKIEKIPDELYTLKSLQSFSFAFNKISELSPKIKQLTNLSLLSLYNNEIKELPDELFDLPMLTHVEARHNQIHKLPDSILGNNSLHKLILTGNPISSKLGKFKALHFLVFNQ